MCSLSCRFSASLIRNIGEFGAKKYFTNHQEVNEILLFIPILKEVFRASSFSEQVAEKGNSPGAT